MQCWLTFLAAITSKKSVKDNFTWKMCNKTMLITHTDMVTQPPTTTTTPTPDSLFQWNKPVDTDGTGPLWTARQEILANC